MHCTGSIGPPSMCVAPHEYQHWCLQMLLPTLHCATAGLKAMGTWSTHLLELHAWRLSQGQRMPSCRLPTRAIAKPVAEEQLTVPLPADIAQVRHRGT